MTSALSSRRIGKSVLTLGCLAGLAACSSSASGPSLAPSDFPGSSVADAYLADDGLAFSDSGTVTGLGDVKVFRNVANGDAIVTFQSDNNNGSGATRLLASHFDGRRFTPPVEILGADEQPQGNRTNVKVLFLNTAKFQGADGTATSNGRGRNGDALIVYVGTDADDVSSPQADDRDANRRVYATYFDRSAVNSAAAGGVVHGFQRVATAIDFDHVFNGGGNDEDAVSAGFASDSLHGTHGFGGTGAPATLSGDATSFVQILFRKAPSVGNTAVENRWFAVPFDLGQTGNAFVAQGGATAGLLTPAVGILEDGDPTGGNVVVADGMVFSQASDVDPNDEDGLVTATSFGAAGASASIVVGSDPTADRDITDLPRPGDVYGPDHGVGGYYAVFTESGFTDFNTGSRAGDRDLMVAQIDVGGSSRVVREIDAHTAGIDVQDVDQDGSDLRSGDAGGISNFAFNAPYYQTRLHLDGSLISVFMMQPNTDLTDLDDNNLNVDTPERNSVPYLQVIQTGRPAANLGTSVLAAPIQAPALLSTGDVNNGVDQENVTNFAFQVGVPDASAAVDGGPNDAADIWQSDANRVFFTYTQYNDQNANGNVPNEIRLFTTGLSITRGVDVATAPTAQLVRGSVAEALVQFPGTAAGSGSDDNWPNNFAAQVVDLGDEAGNFYTFFLSNDNNVPDAGQNAAYASRRLYLWDGWTTQLVSSAGAGNLQQAVGVPLIRLAGNTIHLVWTERLGATNSELGVVARSFLSGATTITATPALGTAPTSIDLPSGGAIGTIQAAVSGTTLGVFIEENGHVYYNETRRDASRYLVAGGLAAPTLVDHDSLIDLEGWSLHLGDGSSPLAASFFVYTKATYNLNADDERVFIRVHD